MSHPEDTCEQCNRPNVTWFAPSSIWNKAVRAVYAPEMLCPVCFIKLAEAAGFDRTAWKVEPEGAAAQRERELEAVLDKACEPIDTRPRRDRAKEYMAGFLMGATCQRLRAATARDALRESKP